MGISWTQPKDLTDYKESKQFFKRVENTSLYSYQLQARIKCSKIRWRRDPLLISAKVL